MDHSPLPLAGGVNSNRVPPSFSPPIVVAPKSAPVVSNTTLLVDSPPSSCAVNA